ncbi:MAG: hypothetical protein JXP34_19180 [Planctomycetes bacterium]|nr:hypothetical protein [Planctomycetota bacterium]
MRRHGWIGTAGLALALALGLASPGPGAGSDEAVDLILQGAEESIREGRFDEAATALDALGDRAAGVPRFHALRARAAAGTGDKDKAAAAWYRLLALATERPDARADAVSLLAEAAEALPKVDPKAKEIFDREKDWAKRLAAVAGRAPSSSPGDAGQEALLLALLLDPTQSAALKLLDRGRNAGPAVHYDLRNSSDCTRFMRDFQVNIQPTYDRQARALRFHPESNNEALVAQHRRLNYGAAFEARLVFRCEPAPNNCIASFHLDERHEPLGPQMGYVDIPFFGENLIVASERIQFGGGQGGGPGGGGRGGQGGGGQGGGAGGGGRGPGGGGGGRGRGIVAAQAPNPGGLPAGLISRGVNPDLSQTVTMEFILSDGRIRGRLNGQEVFDETASPALSERAAGARVTILLDSTPLNMGGRFGGGAKQSTQTTDWILEEVSIGPPPVSASSSSPTGGRPAARDAKIADALMASARIEIDGKRWAKAIPLLERAITSDPGRLDPRLLLAQSKYRSNDKAGALEALTAARQELGPWLDDSEDARLRAARALFDPLGKELEKIRGEAALGYRAMLGTADAGTPRASFILARARACGAAVESVSQAPAGKGVSTR